MNSLSGASSRIIHDKKEKHHMGMIKMFTANRYLLYDRIIRAKSKRYVATLLHILYKKIMTSLFDVQFRLIYLNELFLFR